MLRTGLAVMAVLLAFPAVAVADATVSNAGTTFTLTADGQDDGVVVEVGDDNSGTPGYWFRPFDINTTINGVCELPQNPGGRVCRPDGTHNRIQLDLNAGNDSATLEFSSGAGVPALPATVNGGDGADDITGGPIADALNGQGGTDTFHTGPGADTIDGGPAVDLVIFTTGPALISLDGFANDGPGNANVLPTVENVDGTALSDSITGSPAANNLRGTGGIDSLNGLGGADVLDGGPDNDTIHARDRVVDTVICGAGADTANVDWNDTVAADCETVNRSARDDDADGSARGVDCDDTNASIRPGVPDIPNNGIDEDCAGGDLRSDVDGDGTLPPADCDDTNARVHPGATDRPRNGVNEDCVGGDADWRRNRAIVSTGWLALSSYTQVTRLTFSGIPARGKVRLRCRGGGCPFKTKALRVKNRRASATKLLKGRRLAVGAVLEIRITAPGTMGKVVRYRIRSRALPQRRELCLAPGKRKPGRCG